MFRFVQRWPLLPGLLLLGLFLYMTGPGFGGTSDSTHYLWAARSFRDVGTLLAPDGRPYRFWGPLYPLLLAGFQGPSGARVLHGAALLVHLALWHRLGTRLLAPGPARWLPWLLALNSAVLVPAKFIWSETVFGALAAAYVYAVLTWSGARERRGWLALATAVGFLLPLQRTAGFFLLAGVGAGLVLTGHWRSHWRGLLPHWAGCAAGGLAWSYYAEVLAGPPLYQSAQAAAVSGAVADYGFVLARWLVPLAASWREAAPGWWAVVLLAVLFCLFPKGNAGPALADAPAAARPAAGQQGLRLVWWVVLVTVAALLVATRTGRAAVGPHSAERYCAVLAGPVTLLVLAAWSRFAGGYLVAVKTRRWASGLLLGGWLAYSAARAGHNAQQLRHRPPVVWPTEASAA